METLFPEAEARARLGGIGRSLYYELIANEELRTVKIGRRRMVLGSSISDYIARLEQQEVTRRAAVA